MIKLKSVKASLARVGLVVSLLVSGMPQLAQAEVNPLLQQTFVNMQGASQDLTEWTGKKVLIVNFWASWCPPCITEIPELLAFQAQHDDKVQVVGIGLDEPEKLRNVMRTLSVTYPVLVADPNKDLQLLSQWGDLRGVLPYTVIFDEQGSMFLRNTGPVTSKLLTSYLQELRDKQKKPQ